jgi:hypothetical protein
MESPNNGNGLSSFIEKQTNCILSEFSEASYFN